MNSDREYTILAIDTSCDDTSVAITKGFRVLSNSVSSQIDLHKQWGGVVPDLARRAHLERIEAVIKHSFSSATRSMGEQVAWSDIDVIAVTKGPGLAIALEVGVNKAKELAIEHKLPLFGVNHMQGHLFSALGLNSKGKGKLDYEQLQFPLLGLLLSGGHTQMVKVQSGGSYEIIGETLDDAIGEAYDKVGRMLNLGYPAGPVITQFAKLGNSQAFDLPIPLAKDPRIDFSYSGLKTAVFYKVKKIEEQREFSQQEIYDMCASFEKVAIEHVQQKLTKALKLTDYRMILAGGGVTASPKLRAGIRKIAKRFQIPVFFPPNKKLSIDNAAMIAIAANFNLQGVDDPWQLHDAQIDRDPRLSLEVK